MDRRNTSNKRRGAAKNQSDAWERWLAARLFVCLGLCAVMICIKFFAPGFMEKIRYRGAEIIGESVDFEAAFRTIGQAIAGEKPVKEAFAEAYEYAFSPSDEDEEAVEADAPAEESEEQTVEETEAETETVIVESPPRVESLTNAPESEPASLSFAYTSPAAGVVTSTFGYRNHPVDGVVRFHSGVDIGADLGTAIRAFADGTVYAVGESATLGKYVMIDHPDGVRTVYGHCSEVHVTGGEAVTVGQRIADVGSTGNATGNCLHFEIHIDGAAVDPQQYIIWA